MELSRRDFLKNCGFVAVGFAGLKAFYHPETAPAEASVTSRVGYGGLIPDPEGILDLPVGFKYKMFSRTGEKMDDGFFVPGMHDGMAAFAGPSGRTILVRNHELNPDTPKTGPFGENYELFSRIDPSRLFDSGHGKTPSLGGTSTLVYNTQTQELEASWLSLAGTTRNCAGGDTPWNSWITCEETVERAGDRSEHDHGWCFEVPVTSSPALADPIPLKALGRFNHEAVAVDPATGIIYLTEDRDDGLMFRFIPNRPGKVLEGGKLQALVVKDAPSMDTRNWDATPTIRTTQIVEVDWIGVENVESPEDDLRHQGFARGAARFARGEGIIYGRNSLYICCTNGGKARKGQIWRLEPGRGQRPDRLELFIEPNSSNLVENCDNVTIAPWGDLYVCEDGGPGQYVVGVTPSGRIFRFAHNAMNHSEFAGGTFSPDGSTFFVNIQTPGITFAITGPWDRVV